jgi:hypothetical protein
MVNPNVALKLIALEKACCQVVKGISASHTILSFIKPQPVFNLTFKGYVLVIKSGKPSPFTSANVIKD